MNPAALLALHGDRSDSEFAQDLGVTRRTVVRWRTGATGINSITADRVACSIGHHPLELWPNWGNTRMSSR